MIKTFQFLLLTILATFLSSSCAQTSKLRPAFQDYPAEIYQGKFHFPEGLYKEEAPDEIRDVTGETAIWRNEYGKRVNPSEINFAGKYFLFANSCGTGCRYYDMTDLSTGKDMPTISMFDATETRYMKTKGGHVCVTFLDTRPDSRLVTARCESRSPIAYEKDETGTDGAGIYACEERDFFFDEEDKKFRQITNRRYKCQESR